MAPIQSSQEFVRALKSTLDPPSPGGPLKVEIASQAWKDASLYVPRKAEVVVEWILGKFLKEKSKALSVFFFSLPTIGVLAVSQIVKPSCGHPFLASLASSHLNGRCSVVTPYAPF